MKTTLSLTVLLTMLTAPMAHAREDLAQLERDRARLERQLAEKSADRVKDLAIGTGALAGGAALVVGGVFLLNPLTLPAAMPMIYGGAALALGGVLKLAVTAKKIVEARDIRAQLAVLEARSRTLEAETGGANVGRDSATRPVAGSTLPSRSRSGIAAGLAR